MAALPAVLYLHGLDSHPTPEKTAMIARLGFRVIAPQMHYREEQNLYDRVCKLIEWFQPDWIVGSSLGGYIGFWLSRQFNIPAILINPALSFKEEDPGLVTRFIYRDTDAHIVIGMKDEVVLPDNTFSWLENNKKHFKKVSLYTQKEMGHRIQVDELKNMLQQIISSVGALS
jgi:predicted esterase YcpF (UPF0227 family)